MPEAMLTDIPRRKSTGKKKKFKRKLGTGS